MMSLFEIFMLALAFSIDACTVSFSYGILPLENPKKDKYLLALFTGLFQAIMPVMGYYITTTVLSYISPYSKHIVFGIFLILGLKFIKDAFRNEDKKLCIKLSCLVLIGIATSIDAFSGGISLKLSGNEIIYPALIIGLVTFINSVLGFEIGRTTRKLPIMYMEIIAGIILITLGIKALF